MQPSLFRAAVALAAFSFVTAEEECPDGYTRKPGTGGGSNATITWTDCPTPGEARLQCAILKVPRDYTNIVGGGTIDLPVVRVPAPGSVTSAKSVFYNPGGPGSSSIKHFVGGSGSALQKSYCSACHWITFDPRGVGLNMPFTCKRPSVPRDYHLSWNTPAGMQALYDDSLNVGKACQKEFGSTTGEILGTAFVARDIKALFESLGEDGLIRYLGYSYGTLLGSTVAAMFPDKIDRLVLDGNVNPVEWWRGLRADRPEDSDKALDKFFEFCAEAPDDCDVAVRGSDGPALRKTFEKFETDLDQGKLKGKDKNGYRLTSRGLRGEVFSALYRPSSWSDMAATLYDYYQKATPGVMATNVTARDATLEPRQFDPTKGATDTSLAILAIQCSDWWGVALPSASTTLYQNWRKIFIDKSAFAGDVVVTNPIGCAGWQMNAREKYTGGFVGLKTKNPVLVVQTPYDPITPMKSGQNMTAMFAGSALLVHNGVGHCSSANPGTDTAVRIASYFATGVLPEVTTQTQPNKRNPFVGAAFFDGDPEDEDEEDFADEFEDPYDCDLEDSEDEENDECELGPEGTRVRIKRDLARRTRALAKLSKHHQREDHEWDALEYPRALLEGRSSLLEARAEPIPDYCVPITSPTPKPPTSTPTNPSPTPKIPGCGKPGCVPEGYTTTVVFCGKCATPGYMTQTIKIVPTNAPCTAGCAAGAGKAGASVTGGVLAPSVPTGGVGGGQGGSPSSTPVTSKPPGVVTAGAKKLMASSGLGAVAVAFGLMLL